MAPVAPAVVVWGVEEGGADSDEAEGSEGATGII